MAQVQEFLTDGTDVTTLNLTVDSAMTLAQTQVEERDNVAAALVCTNDGIVLRAYTK
jgi:hypothetical protein